MGNIADKVTSDVIEHVATRAPYVTGATAIVGGLTLNEIGVIVGIVGTVITVTFNIWFKLHYRTERRNKRGRKGGS